MLSLKAHVVAGPYFFAPHGTDLTVHRDLPLLNEELGLAAGLYRRRKLQQAYNEEHGITPKTIQKSVRDLIAISKKVAAEEMEFDKDPESMSRRELEKLIGDIQKKMTKAAADLNFEAAAEYRDKMVSLKNMLRDIEK